MALRQDFRGNSAMLPRLPGPLVPPAPTNASTQTSGMNFPVGYYGSPMTPMGTANPALIRQWGVQPSAQFSPGLPDIPPITPAQHSMTQPTLAQRTEEGALDALWNRLKQPLPPSGYRQEVLPNQFQGAPAMRGIDPRAMAMMAAMNNRQPAANQGLWSQQGSAPVGQDGAPMIPIGPNTHTTADIPTQMGPGGMFGGQQKFVDPHKVPTGLTFQMPLNKTQAWQARQTFGPRDSGQLPLMGSGAGGSGVQLLNSRELRMTDPRVPSPPAPGLLQVPSQPVNYEQPAIGGDIAGVPHTMNSPDRLEAAKARVAQRRQGAALSAQVAQGNIDRLEQRKQRRAQNLRPPQDNRPSDAFWGALGQALAHDKDGALAANPLIQGLLTGQSGSRTAEPINQAREQMVDNQVNQAIGPVSNLEQAGRGAERAANELATMVMDGRLTYDEAVRAAQKKDAENPSNKKILDLLKERYQQKQHVRNLSRGYLNGENAEMGLYSF